MKINRKYQCKKCLVIVEENGTCACGNMTVKEGSVFLKEGTLGFDAVDLSPQLLNEDEIVL
ncbi:MAG: hypothetical protein QXG00_07400 [Candidatus Woesearchaeota archaeon]